MAELNSNGLITRTYEEHLQRVKDKILAIEPAADLRDESFLGKLAQMQAAMLVEISDELRAAYAACDLDSTSGQPLANIGQTVGVSPRLGTHSTAIVSLSGVAGTLIAKGTQVRHTSNATIWTTNNQATIPADVGVTCVTRGAQTAGVGELSEIVSPVGGWQSVTNADAAATGDDDESDSELRVSIRTGVSAIGSNQLDSIFGEVAKIKGITHLRVEMNDEKITDSNGLQPNSVIVIAQGGDDDEILEAIMRKKPPGAKLQQGNGHFPNRVEAIKNTPLRNIQRADGSIVQTGGSAVSLCLVRPELETIHITITIVKTEQVVSSSLVADIKKSIIEYVNATLFESKTDLGFDQTGFEVGESVPVSKLYTPVNKVLGSQGYISSLGVGESAGSMNQVVNIGFAELATFAESNISVSVS